MNIFLQKEIIKYKSLLLLIIFLISTSLSYANKMNLQQIIKEKKVTINVNNRTLDQILILINKQSDIGFTYEGVVDKSLKFSLSVTNVTVENALTILLKRSAYTFTLTDNLICILKRPVSSDVSVKSAVEIKGVVLFDNGDPVIGATITIPGSTRGVITNDKGLFRLVTVSNSLIEVTYTGYKTVEVKITKSVDNLVIKMNVDVLAIDDVVVSMGLFDVDKRKMTSSVTSLKAEEIVKPGMATIDLALEGNVPGMTFMRNSGQVGAAPKIKVRGTTTLLGNQSPLWVVDGFIVTDPVNVRPEQFNDLDFVNLLGNAISGLNPEDIDQIDVLKDASATAIYGPKASNGVIVITTKKGKIGTKPTIGYSGSATFRQRPSYNDKAVNVMNSQERIDYSRQQMESKLNIFNSGVAIGYESAYSDYMKGDISHADFVKRVNTMENANTDWLNILLQNTISHNHTFNISGGSQALRYYASLGYMDERGNIKGETNKRYSSMMNLNLNYSKFSAQFGLSGSVQDKRYTPQNVGVMNYAQNTSRAIPAFNEDGSYFSYLKPTGLSGSPDNYYSMMNEMDNAQQNLNTNSFGVKISLNYHILKSLKASAAFSYNMANSNQDTFYDEKSYYIKALKRYNPKTDTFNKALSECPTGGEIKLDNTKNSNYTVRASLTYSEYLGAMKNHNLNVSVIGDLNSSEYNGFAIKRRGYQPDRGLGFDPYDPVEFPAYNKWLLSSSDARGLQSHNLTNLVGLIGTVSYSFRNDLILNTNIRIDASNKFGDQSNEKLLPIWSVSGRWNMHENIVKSAKWIDNLALKMSFGYQGNMSASESPRLIIKRGLYSSFFQENISEIYNFPNPTLGWEKTATYNTELEYSLFKNKVVGTFSYYYRHTQNAFISKNVSSFNGINSYTVNGGELTNQGFEFTFNFTPIDNMVNKVGALASTGLDKKGFVWRFNPNFGTVINQLISKAKPKDKIIQDPKDVKVGHYLDGKVLVAGRPINSFYSFEYMGLNQNNGSPLFARVEPENAEQYDLMQKDDVFRTVLVHSGAREPFLQGGISNYFGWGNFGLNINLSYSFGSKIRKFMMYPNGGDPVSPDKNMRRELAGRWRQSGDLTDVPAILQGDDKEAASKPWWQSPKVRDYSFGNLWFMYDNSNLRTVSGNYVKIQNVSFRFVVPNEFCRKLSLKSAYVNLSCSDIYTFCSSKLKGQDPMQSGTSELISMSIRPTYSLQVNISF